MDNRERARARDKKTKETNFFGKKYENFIAAVRKCEMLATTKVKMSGSEKKQTGCNWEVDWKFHVVVVQINGK